MIRPCQRTRQTASRLPFHRTEDQIPHLPEGEGCSYWLSELSWWGSSLQWEANPDPSWTAVEGKKTSTSVYLSLERITLGAGPNPPELATGSVDTPHKRDSPLRVGPRSRVRSQIPKVVVKIWNLVSVVRSAKRPLMRLRGWGRNHQKRPPTQGGKC
jgi:hypothetical protein